MMLHADMINLFSYKKMQSRLSSVLEFWDCVFIENFRGHVKGSKAVEIQLDLKNKIMIVKTDYVERNHLKYNITLELNIS